MEGLSADRYVRIEDFTKNIALIPISAKTGRAYRTCCWGSVGSGPALPGSGAQDRGRAAGTILKVKEEKGLGPTIDVILSPAPTWATPSRSAPGTNRSSPRSRRSSDRARWTDPRPPRQVRIGHRGHRGGRGQGHVPDAGGRDRRGAVAVIKGNKEAVLEEITKETKVNIETADSGSWSRRTPSALWRR